jgi:hypothetical protein
VNPTRELLLSQLLPSVPSRSCRIVESRAVQASWRAGRGAAGGFRAAFHPAVRIQVLIKEAVSRRPGIAAGQDPCDRHWCAA